MELQKSLDDIDKTHRRKMFQIDSKLKENEQHLESIEDTLIEELNNLKSDIDSGRKRLIVEFEKLKKLRSQSEETFLSGLKEMEVRYNQMLDEILEQEEKKI
jgi:hypothetical protein